MKTIKLPSGAELSIDVAPFADARALYQACLEEGKILRLDPTAEVDANLFKDLLCTALSSKKIEAAITKCMERALYNKLKITNDTWEPVEARDDYMTACLEVAKENILPFTKSLYAQYAGLLERFNPVRE